MSTRLGYVVGQVHPSCQRRQFSDLDPGEVADLGDALVFALARELVLLDVAGAQHADRWSLAHELRRVVVEHHAAACSRTERAQARG